MVSEVICKKSLQNLINCPLNKPAVLAGTGPSLRHLDPVDTSSFVLIPVNAAINKFQNAQYFLSADPRIVLYNIWQNLKLIRSFNFLARPAGYDDWSRYDKYTGENYFKGIEDRSVHVVSRADSSNLVFDSKDTDLAFGHSSAFCACHLAYLMGCSPIILAGCDCGPEDGKYYYYDFPGQEQYALEFTDEKYRELVETPNTPILVTFVSYWNLIAKQNPGGRIVNCGNCNINGIPKMEIKDVLKILW